VKSVSFNTKIKLKKYLSNAGYCSRRKATDYIEDNSILINSKNAKHDDILEHGDVLVINKKREIVNLKLKTEILIYHKPTGEICSTVQTETNKSVYQSIPNRKKGKWIMVGRLDVNTSGLLVFSNNGDLVQKLSHPSSMIERKYLCRIFGKPTTSQIQNLLNGALIDGKKSSFDKLTPIKKQSDAMNNWFRVTLHSGRNREVRKLWESQSIQVNRLIRIGFGPIALPENLKKGQYRYLTENEIDNLLKLLELEN